MKIKIVLAVTLCVFINSPVHSASLKEISEFAKDICDEIDVGGNITRKQIEGKIEGKVSGLAKLIGASVGVDGKLKIDDTNYTGLPYENVAEQMTGARDCRKQLATMLIDERNRIASEETKEPKNKSCRHPDFGLESWANKETLSQSSGWEKGGSNQDNWCNKFIAQVVQGRSIGPIHKATVIKKSEKAKWTWDRKRLYNYKCTIKMEWNPIYVEKTDPRC